MPWNHFLKVLVANTLPIRLVHPYKHEKTAYQKHGCNFLLRGVNSLSPSYGKQQTAHKYTKTRVLLRNGQPLQNNIRADYTRLNLQ